jgi:hypothetical protein
MCWRRCWYGWGGSRLLAMASLAAGQRTALASPRRDQDGTVFHPPTGWTVFHLLSTPGTCEPFNPQPTDEINRGRPHTTDETLTAPSAHTPLVVLPRCTKCTNLLITLLQKLIILVMKNKYNF